VALIPGCTHCHPYTNFEAAALIGEVEQPFVAEIEMTSGGSNVAAIAEVGRKSEEVYSAAFAAGPYFVALWMLGQVVVSYLAGLVAAVEEEYLSEAG